MKVIKTIVFLFVLISIYSVQSLAASEPKITFSVKALFKDRAMIEINGIRHILSAGEQSPEGIKLLSSDVNKANIVCHGKEYTLYLNQTAYSGVSTESNKKTGFKIPKKLIPGKTIPFMQTNINGMTKYMLKNEYDNPAVMEYGQDAIWIATGKKLLRFDIKKEAWGEFNLSNDTYYRITNLAISDKSVILNATKQIKNKKRSGLFLLDTRTSELHQQLDMTPGSYEFIGEKLWFLDSDKGLGYFYPKKNNPSISYKDALLYKDKSKDKDKNKEKAKSKNKKSEKAYILSANGDDIWYSHRTKFNQKHESRRLNETCVSRYNKKSKTFKKFTRKEMGLDVKYNCSYLAVSKEQVWVSHESKDAGLSVFNTSSKQWRHIPASANNIQIGGDIIVLDNNQLWLRISNQLIGLNTKTLHANVIWGNAVVMNPRPWQSKFYVKNGYAWYVTKESPDKKPLQKPVKPKLVLYKIPVNPTVRQASLGEFN